MPDVQENHNYLKCKDFHNYSLIRRFIGFIKNCGFSANLSKVSEVLENNEELRPLTTMRQ